MCTLVQQCKMFICNYNAPVWSDNAQISKRKHSMHVTVYFSKVTVFVTIAFAMSQIVWRYIFCRKTQLDANTAICSSKGLQKPYGMLLPNHNRRRARYRNMAYPRTPSYGFVKDTSSYTAWPNRNLTTVQINR